MNEYSSRENNAFVTNIFVTEIFHHIMKQLLKSI